MTTRVRVRMRRRLVTTVTTAVLVVGSAVGTAAASVPSGGGSPYASVAHRQVLHAAVAPKAVLSFALAGVPSVGVSAVVLSVAVVAPATSGTLTVYPYKSHRPGVFSLSFDKHHAASGKVVVSRGSGRASVYNASAKVEHVSATVVGYYATPGSASAARATTGFVGVPPRRLVSLSVKRSGAAAVVVLGKAGVPENDVAGVVVSVTAVAPARTGSLVVYPAGSTKPVAGRIAFVAGRSVTATVVVKPGSQGRLTVASTQAVRVYVDVVGYLRVLLPPSAPLSVTATPLAGAARVQWSAPASDGGSPLTTYTVTAAPGGATTTINAAETSATLTSLTNGTAYTFTVVAANGRGSGPGSAASTAVVPVGPPGSPSAVVASSPSAGTAVVSWAPPADSGGSPVTSYRVVASPGGAVTVSLGVSVTINGLAPGQGFTYDVTSTTAVGTSAPSGDSNFVIVLGSSRSSVSTAGAQGDGAAQAAVVSGNGRYVVFTSNADNMAAGDTNGTSDVFVRDRLLDTTTLVSVNASGQASGNGPSQNPAVSADGRYVVFDSSATDLVRPATTMRQVYLRDLVAGTTTLVSGDAGREADSPSLLPTISSDGSTMAFETKADNLVSVVGGQDGTHDIVVLKSRTTFVFSLGSMATDEGQPSNDATQPALSSTGRYVAFISTASNLVASPAGGVYAEAYVRDMTTTTTSMVSTANGTTAGDGPSTAPAVSGDGRYVVFESTADNLLTTPDTNAAADIFVRDTTTAAVTRVSVGPLGVQGNGPSHNPTISGDGRYVAFDSAATNLVAGLTPAFADVYRSDWQTDATRLVVTTPTGTESDQGGYGADISTDGSHLVLVSNSTNLTAGDTNGLSDIYAADLG